MTSEVALSQSARMLTGAGIMAMVPYQIEPGPDLHVIAHGLDHLGRLVVACDYDAVAHLDDTAVRFTITMKAPEFSLDIISAHLHAVGDLQWKETAGALRYGLVDVKRVFLQGAGGTYSFDFDEALASALNLPDIDTDALHARDIVGQLSQAELQQLAGGVRAKEILGAAITSFAEEAGRTHCDDVLIADISEVGLVLMQVRSRIMQLALVRFPRRVKTFKDLHTAVHDLAVLAEVCS